MMVCLQRTRARFKLWYTKNTKSSQKSVSLAKPLPFYVFCSVILFTMLYIIQKHPRRPNNYLTDTDVADGSLKNSNQDDPKILQYIQKYHLKPPSNGVYNLTPIDPTVNKRWNNSLSTKVLELLNYKTDGFFVECGANDGEFLSNTLSMELKYGWSGILIEADPEPLKVLLKRNRKAWIAYACLATGRYPQMVKMLRHKRMNGMSYIKKYLGERSSSDYTIQFKTQCFPLFSILSALNVTVVDYLSLDIEGAELAVLKTFPFDGPILIKVISAEVHTGTKLKLKKFLESKGYRLTNYIRGPYVHDLIFAHESVPVVDSDSVAYVAKEFNSPYLAMLQNFEDHEFEDAI